MACAQWLYHRVWCGGFPLFHLPTQDEAACEQRLSQTCFTTHEFFELRMQIRLKLTEAPPITHTRPPSTSGATNEPFAVVLGLLERYVPYLLALERIMAQTPALPVQLPAPLFHGLGGVNLDLEAQSSPLPVSRWLTVEKVLVWFAMAQLRAVQAENRAARGLQLQDERALTRAEEEWASSQRLACLSAATAGSGSLGTPAVNSSVDSTAQEESVRPTVRLLEAASVFAHALAHLCALRQIATHLSSLTLTVERSERLARVASAFARRAFQLARDAASVLNSYSLDVELARQISWCLGADAVRWKAVYVHCEQSIFQLDANPELALLFAEVLLTLKLPTVPRYSRCDAPFFTRITQELQLLLSSQLTQALDDKKELLRVCQQRYGPTWIPPDHEKTKDLAVDTSMESQTPDLAAKLPTWDAVVASVVSENAFELVDTTKLESAITRNLQRAQNRMNGLPIESESESSSITQVSTLAMVGDKTGVSTQRQEQIGNSSRASLNMASTASSQLHARQLPAAATLPGKRALDKLPPRPSSAEPSLPTPAADPADSRSWVMIQHAGKTLHFEKVLPRETAQDRTAARRNAVPLADVDGTPNATNKGTLSANRLDRLTVLKRPASSPSYLPPAKISGQLISVSSRVAMTTPGPRMWTPTRFSCALCEQRFMRCNLPGVAVMKRVFDLRCKWGVVLHDAKKFAAPSALYAKANVCLMCQEILQFDDSSSTDASIGDSSSNSGDGTGSNVSSVHSSSSTGDDVGLMIHNAIICQRDLQQHSQHHSEGHTSEGCEKLHLVDIAQRKRARQSSTICSMAARYAVQPGSERCSHTKEERQPWWEVDLANYVVVHSVKLYLRSETSHLYTSSSSSSTSSPARLQHQSGVFPLHIALSMKSGVGRDLDDVVASCVSSQKFEDTHAASVGAGALLVVWTLPPNARGRFVRIQSERVALLHIERVHVFVAQVPLSLSLLAEAGANSDARRRKLQRAAFRASVIAGSSNGSGGGATAANGATSGQHERRVSRSSGAGSLLLSSLLDQPEQTEKKRLSKLYARFRLLLEQRSRYDAHDAVTKDSKVETASIKPTIIHSE